MRHRNNDRWLTVLIFLDNIDFLILSASYWKYQTIATQITAQSGWRMRKLAISGSKITISWTVHNSWYPQTWCSPGVLLQWWPEAVFIYPPPRDRCCDYLDFPKDIHSMGVLSAQGTSAAALISSSSLESSVQALCWTFNYATRDEGGEYGTWLTNSIFSLAMYFTHALSSRLIFLWYIE